MDLWSDTTFNAVLGFVLGFGWEQYVTTGIEKCWVIASTILLSSVSVHDYVVDSII